MSTSVSSLTTNFFPSAENGFTTTTSGSVSSGAATVGLNSVAGYTNGEVAVFVIDPTDASKKQTFTGVIDTSGVQVTSVVWTAGTNQTHALGATVVDYATATHISMITKGVTQEHNQDGTHGDVTADSLVVDTTLAVTGATTHTGAVALNGGYTTKLSNEWVGGSGTWTYASATTFTVPSADAALMSVGTKIWLTQTTSKYFYVTGISGTTITVTAGSDYTVANAAITAPYFSNAATPVGFPQWFNWTVSWTNLTQGNGTLTSKFAMVAKTVHLRLLLDFGTTTSISGSVSLALPVTAASGYSSGEGSFVGPAKFLDQAVASYIGNCQLTSTTNIQPTIGVSSGTYTTNTGITATVPFAYGNGDELSLSATYEAA